MRVRSGHRMHRIEAHAKARGEQIADRVEIEQRLHQRGILNDRVDDLDRGCLDGGRFERVEIDIGRVGNLVLVDRLAARENRIGNFFRRGAAVAGIVFDAEIAVRAARIVAGGQDDAAERAQRPDQP